MSPEEIKKCVVQYVGTDCEDPNAFALIIEDDFLSPMIRSGDRVIVAPNAPLKNGEIAVVRFRDRRVMIRRYHREGESIRLTWDNAPEIETRAADIEFAYRVYGVTRFL